MNRTTKGLRRTGVFFIAILLFLGAHSAHAQPEIYVEEEGASEEELARAFEALESLQVPTGLLHDRVVSFVDVTRFDGTRLAARASLEDWRQAYYELSRSRVGAADVQGRTEALRQLPALEVVDQRAAGYLREGVVPLALLDIRYSKGKDEPSAQQRLQALAENPRRATPHELNTLFETHQAFAVTAYKAQSSSPHVRFVLAPELYLTNGEAQANRFEVDFGDGRGLRPVRMGSIVNVAYTTGGVKTLRVVAYADGLQRQATTSLKVAEEPIPEPDRTWLDQTARRGYAGGRASWEAYAFYGAGNARLTRPIVYVEGFDVYYSDPAQRRTWQDIYQLLTEEDYLATTRRFGYDAVIFKLHNATDYIQRNAFALVDLLEMLSAELQGQEEIVVVAPSMGGLIARYALAYMEQEGLSHRVRLYVSVDAPHQGANVPLGDQYLFEFYDGDSPKALEGKRAVNSVAARQMLVYHYRSFPRSHPLRLQFMEELGALGYPADVEKVAIASGSGYGLAQLGNERVDNRRMRPGDKIVEYRYRSFFLRFDGDVWALPDGDTRTRIFEGRKRIGILYRAENIYVSGTRPLDGAPGGSRGTQGEIVSADPPYGRMHTSFPDHTWIPTTSALDLDTSDLFYNVEEDPDGLTREQHDGQKATAEYAAIYYPRENERHVDPNEENVRFLLQAIDPAMIDAPALAGAALSETSVLESNYPNPFHTTTEIRFVLSEPDEVSLVVYDALGREVAQLIDDRHLEAGQHRVTWAAEGLSSGVYLYRLVTGDRTAVRRAVLVR